MHVALSRLVMTGVLAGSMVAGANAIAEDATFTVATQPGTLQQGERMAGSEMRLTLRDAIEMALAHNIDLEVSRLSLASSRKAIVAATGIFDPLVELSFQEAQTTSPATSVLEGAQVVKTKRRTFDVGFSQRFATGAGIAVSWNNRRDETNSTNYFLNPSYNAGFSLDFTQPFLAGFGTDVNRAGIEIARRNRDISDLEFRRIVISTIQQVEDAYWNLVYTRENLAVARQSLKLAQDLLDQTRTRVRIGTSAPIDIVQSEATVAAREQDIILAENAVDAAADLLKQLMGFQDAEDWKARVVAVDDLETSPHSVDLDEAIDTALAKRVELAQSTLSSEVSEINLVTAHNAVKPKLDLVARYGYAGVGGNIINTSTGEIIARGGWGDALQQITDRDFNYWTAGVNFSIPLGNNQAKATLAQRRFELSSAQQRLAAARQGVIAEVRGAVRGLDAGLNLIAASVKARELAERNLDAEQKKFANGMSTNYQVLQIQEDLATAQVTELQSRVAYRQALVAYEVAAGDLLEAMGVSLAQSETEREPHRFLSNVEWLRYSHWANPLATEQKPAAEAAGEEGGEQ